MGCRNFHFNWGGRQNRARHSIHAVRERINKIRISWEKRNERSFFTASCAIFSNGAMSRTGFVLFAPYQIAATKSTPVEQVYLKHVVRPYVFFRKTTTEDPAEGQGVCVWDRSTGWFESRRLWGASCAVWAVWRVDGDFWNPVSKNAHSPKSCSAAGGNLCLGEYGRIYVGFVLNPEDFPSSWRRNHTVSPDDFFF